LRARREAKALKKDCEGSFSEAFGSSNLPVPDHKFKVQVSRFASFPIAFAADREHRSCATEDRRRRAHFFFLLDFY
jgi:hypothetical protein